MTRSEIAFAVVAGLLINEVGEWCPWLARWLVRWSARHRYRDKPDRSAVRSEELAALIDRRPGKLLKLGTALGFAAATAFATAFQAATEIIRKTCRRYPTTASYAGGSAVGIALASGADAIHISDASGIAWVVVAYVCTGVGGGVASFAMGRSRPIGISLGYVLLAFGITASRAFWASLIAFLFPLAVASASAYVAQRRRAPQDRRRRAG